MLQAPQIWIFLWTTSSIASFRLHNVSTNWNTVEENVLFEVSAENENGYHWPNKIFCLKDSLWACLLLFCVECKFLKCSLGMLFLHHSCLKGWIKLSLQLSLTVMGRFMPFQVVIMENTYFYCFLLLLEVPVKVCQGMYQGLQSSMERWKLLLQPTSRDIASKLPSAQVPRCGLYASAAQVSGVYVTSCSPR